MAWVEQYYSYFIGAALLALVILHPTLSQTIVGSLNRLLIKVTDLGQVK